MACLVIEKLGLDHNVKVKLNSLGSDVSRGLYRKALIAHFAPYKESLCLDCQMRYEKNPLRILDCKKDSDSEAMKTGPEMVDYLIPEDLTYFNAVKEGLTITGIPYEYDKNLVRGFDYYTHTIFEVQADIPGFGAQTTLCGGGRYDKLVEELGGPATPGIGFGMGLERILLALDAAGIQHGENIGIDVFFLPMGEAAKMMSVEVMRGLRAVGISCEADYSGRKLKNRFKLADDSKAKYIIVIGDNEVASRQISVKDAITGEESIVKVDELIKFFGSLG